MASLARARPPSRTSLIVALASCLSACGASSAADDGGAREDASQEADSGASVDAAIDPEVDGGPPIRACPSSGPGAIVAPGPCGVFTPAQAGASGEGVNADVLQYALEPVGTPRGVLVVQLNGSFGTPAGQIADRDVNLYSTLAQAGFHVIGLAYRSTATVGALCAGAPECFAPARESLVLGTYVDGAPSELADVRADEGIVWRLDAALSLLVAARPSGGWASFVASTDATDAADRIAWSAVIASGHSQGGGHAAYLGRLFPLRRVVQLSSTCDAVRGVPAPWTRASEPWATDPAERFVGFAAPTTFAVDGTPTSGDTICPFHAAVWANMGLDPSRRQDDAEICGATGDTHAASIACVDNAPRWASLFE